MALDINNYDPGFRYGAQAQTDDFAAASVTGAKLITGAGYFTVAVNTNGTTPVDVFGVTNGFAGTIVDVFTISRDTSNGSITLATNAASVASGIVKSTSIGGMAGTITTATAFTAAGTMQVVSSSSANARVVAIFTVA